MVKEVSAGAVIFRMQKGQPVYLLLKARFKAEYWGFPKGLVEKGESAIDTAIREAREETGIKSLEVIPGFEKKITWFYKRQGKTIYKEAVFFLMQARQSKIKISAEHIGAGWFSYRDALKKLIHANSRQVLKAAHLRVSKIGKSITN